MLLHRFAPHDVNIGRGVSDHVLVNMLLFVVPQDIRISRKDIYMPLFAVAPYSTTRAEGTHETGSEGDSVLVNFDFFAGQLNNLLYIVGHFFIVFFPQPLKRLFVRSDWAFRVYQGIVRVVVLIIQVLSQAYAFLKLLYPLLPKDLKPLFEFRLMFAVLKFSPQTEGRCGAPSNLARASPVPSTLSRG